MMRLWPPRAPMLHARRAAAPVRHRPRRLLCNRSAAAAVLFTTRDRFQAMMPQLRQLVLAMRRATGFIHREPAKAARRRRAHQGDDARQEGLQRAAVPPRSRPCTVAWCCVVCASMDRLRSPLQVGMRSTRRRRWRRRAARTDAATMAATLPAFPNDNGLSIDYFNELMSWLVGTDKSSRGARPASCEDLLDQVSGASVEPFDCSCL